MKKETLKITGMTCAACAARIEKVVGKMAGVEQISVNLATEKATISFDPEKTDISMIKEKIYGFCLLRFTTTLFCNGINALVA